MYCPRCKSRLYPGDAEYMTAVGVCSNCVTYDNTPDKRLRAKFEEYEKKNQKVKK